MYYCAYTESDSSNTVQLTLDATTDREAVEEVKRLVEAGFRGETSASVDLLDGRLFQSWNVGGVAHHRYLPNGPY